MLWTSLKILYSYSGRKCACRVSACYRISIHTKSLLYDYLCFYILAIKAVTAKIKWFTSKTVPVLSLPLGCQTNESSPKI